MSINSFATITSQKWWIHLTSVILLYSIISTTLSFSVEIPLCYTTSQCSSFLPGPSPKHYLSSKHSLSNKSPLKQIHTGYYTNNGDQIFTQSHSYNHNSAPHLLNSVSFQAKTVHETGIKGLFKVKASLRLQGSLAVTGTRISYLTLKCWLSGFWSEVSGKLFMVGSGKGNSKEGNLLELAVVLKLNNLKNSSNISSLVFGTLESLSSDKSMI